jgi:L-alanine-DL-glutamate epimerase-like enolase superfamily enzyme
MTDETKKRIRKNFSDPLQSKIIALNIEIVSLRVEILGLPIYDLTGRKRRLDRIRELKITIKTLKNT